MIADDKIWLYLEVTKHSALLGEIKFKHNGECCCLTCLHSLSPMKIYAKINLFMMLLCLIKK